MYLLFRGEGVVLEKEYVLYSCENDEDNGCPLTESVGMKKRRPPCSVFHTGAGDATDVCHNGVGGRVKLS